jgi:hypothetical protein
VLGVFAGVLHDLGEGRREGGREGKREGGKEGGKEEGGGIR